MIEPAETRADDLICVQAGSYREALEKIHYEYGAGFRIAHTRVVRREGIMGMVGGRGVEVFLLPSGQVAKGQVPAGQVPTQPSSTGEGTGGTYDVHGSARGHVPIQPAVGSNISEPLRAPTDTGSGAPLLSEAAQDLQRQIKRLLKARNQELHETDVVAEGPKRKGRSLHARVILDALDKAREASPELVTESSPIRAPLLSAAHPVLRAACRLLVTNGFPPEVATELTNELRKKRLTAWRSTSGDEDADAEFEARRLLGDIARPKLPPCSPIALHAEDGPKTGPRVIALVGPTGVGKTTTIAKLSAPLRLVHRRRIGLITLDTFRLGAIEQISRYAEIVGLEVRAVERPDQLAAALAEFHEFDVVFIDTAGTSPKNTDHLDHVRRILALVENVEVHLCLSASVTRDALVETVQRYRPLAFDRLLITKADEAVGAGHLMDLFDVAKVPVSYMTCGQDVPEDIATATTERLESLLFGEVK